VIIPTVQDWPGPLYQTQFSIPVGNMKLINYFSVGGEISGPDALAVLPDDTFLIADIVANRLLHFDPAGNLLGLIQLTPLKIRGVADLLVKDNELILLGYDLAYSSQLYRIIRLSLDGKLVASEEIPAAVQRTLGFGIAADCEGNEFLDMGGGLHQLNGSGKQSTSTGFSDSYSCNGNSYSVGHRTREEPVSILGGDWQYSTPLTTGFGGLRIAAVYRDGSLYLQR